MKTILSSVIRRGQVTIPVEVLRQFGIRVPGKIQFAVTDDGVIELRPVRHTIESLRGIVPALSRESEGDFDEMIEEAKEEAFEARAKQRSA